MGGGVRGQHGVKAVPITRKRGGEEGKLIFIPKTLRFFALVLFSWLFVLRVNLFCSDENRQYLMWHVVLNKIYTRPYANARRSACKAFKHYVKIPPSILKLCRVLQLSSKFSPQKGKKKNICCKVTFSKKFQVTGNLCIATVNLLFSCCKFLLCLN